MEIKRTCPIDGCMKLFEYGKSFVITKNNKDNNPRFLIDSRCTVIDRGNKEDYYLVEECKGENTYSKESLFVPTSFLLFPIFGKEETIAYRKFKYYKNGEEGEYKKTYKKGEIWGDRDFLIKEIDGELLDTTDKIINATKEGRRLMGRLKIKKGIEVIIDFPIKTINIHDGVWQVDTGYIPVPEFYKYPVEKISSFKMGFIAFNNFGIAEIITEGLVELIDGCKAVFVASDKDLLKITNPEIYLYAV